MSLTLGTAIRSCALQLLVFFPGSFQADADLLNNHIDDSTGTVIIDDGAGNTITLQGITSIGQLDAGDFLF